MELNGHLSFPPSGCHPAVRCNDRLELCPPSCRAEWHVAVHADSDSLFRHDGKWHDCLKCGEAE